MSMIIAGLGTAVPSHSISQADAYVATEQICCDSDEHRRVMGLIYQGTGVQSRGNVLLSETNGVSILEQNFFWQRHDEQDRGPTTRSRMEKYQAYAFDLALEACQVALKRADQNTSEITHLLTVSCTGCFAPGIDVDLICELGLSPDTARTHLGFMGCHGSFNAMRVAKAIIEADALAVVIICSVELCSLHHHYGWSTEKVTANALFGDGAAAVVCRASPPNQTCAQPKFELLRNGTHLIAGTKKAMTWQIGDHGFEMTLSRRVTGLIKKNLKPWLQGFLGKSGMTIEAVSTWAIHGLGPCVLNAFVDALSLHPDQVAISRDILAESGNMSSATILFLLQRVQEDLRSGSVVALGIGPGLTIESMILNCDNEARA